MRSAGSGGMRGSSCSRASLTVAPESPSARHATGRPVRRASARAVVAATDSSPRASPTPHTVDSPMASSRIGFPHLAPTRGRAVSPAAGRARDGASRTLGHRGQRPRSPTCATEETGRRLPRMPSSDALRRSGSWRPLVGMTHPTGRRLMQWSTRLNIPGLRDTPKTLRRTPGSASACRGVAPHSSSTNKRFVLS